MKLNSFQIVTRPVIMPNSIIAWIRARPESFGNYDAAILGVQRMASLLSEYKIASISVM